MMWMPPYWYFPQIPPPGMIPSKNDIKTQAIPGIKVEPSIDRPIPIPIDKKQKIESGESGLWNFVRKLLKAKYRKRIKKTWGRQEDLLIMKCGKQKANWEEVSQKIGANTENCIRRYKRLIKEEKKWPSELNELIKEMAETQDADWNSIAEQVRLKFPQFATYSGKVIRERYKNYLKPGIEKKPWDIDDDMKLLKLVHELGTQWEEISQEMPGRSEMEIKNRFHGILEPISRKAQRNYKLFLKKQNKSQPIKREEPQI